MTIIITITTMASAFESAGALVAAVNPIFNTEPSTTHTKSARIIIPIINRAHNPFIACYQLRVKHPYLLHWPHQQMYLSNGRLLLLATIPQTQSRMPRLHLVKFRAIATAFPCNTALGKHNHIHTRILPWLPN